MDIPDGTDHYTLIDYIGFANSDSFGISKVDDDIDAGVLVVVKEQPTTNQQGNKR